MNGKFYPNPTFPSAGNYEYESPAPVRQPISEDRDNSSIMQTEENNYIKNILKNNKGNKAEVYCTFSDSKEWRDKKIDGIVEEAGEDSLIMSNPKNGEWYLIPMKYINYISFEEKIKI